jgi:hypothetical protein
LVLFFVAFVNAKYQFGVLRTKEQWAFLSKFCFSNEGSENGGFGLLNYTTTTDNTNLKLLLYKDYENSSIPGSWYRVYGRNLSCNQKVNMTIPNGVIDISRGSSTASGHINTWDITRPHFWFLAVADCVGNNGIQLTYSLLFLSSGGPWYQQFSFDEQGLLQLYIFFFLFYVVLCAFHSWGVFQFIKRDAYHPILRLLTSALALELFSNMFLLIHYGVYKDNGVGVVGLKGIGELLNMGAELVLMFMLILVAKGWAITTNYLTDRNLLLLLMGMLLLAYLALFIWDNSGRDSASTLYFYESVPGIFVLILRSLTWLWFAWCLKKTLALETLPEKRTFYIFFGIACTLWFLLLPLFVIIATAMEAWYREKVITSMTSSLNALALVAFTYLLWPTRAADYFSIKPANALLSSDIDTPSDSMVYGTTDTSARAHQDQI